MSARLLLPKVALLALLVTSTGCLGKGIALPHGSPGRKPGGEAAAWIDNPLFVPHVDREFLWNQVVDTTDDYFKIAREEPVRQVGNVITEGRLYTYPRVGSTILEPWRRDSTPGFEKLHATLQSIRRQAEIRVTPTAGGYFVEVAVKKELEDVDQPEYSNVGSATLRHDGSLVRARTNRLPRPATLGWIPQGRDLSLEQQILAELHARLGL